MPQFKAPIGLGDKEAVRQYRDDVLDFSREYRWESDRSSLRNILYYLGIHWVRYDWGLRIYRLMGLKKGTPRPVTNRVATGVNTIASNLVAYKPPITYAPTSSEAGAVASANVADKVVEVIEREANIRKLKPYAARWLALTGNVFLVSNYDNSLETGMTFIPSERCLNPECRGVSSPAQYEANSDNCPHCNTPAPSEAAIDEVGQPIGEEYAQGKFLTELQSVFSVCFDPEAGYIEDSPYFLVNELRTKDWVANTYGNDVADRVPEDKSTDPYSHYIETIAYSSSISGGMGGVGTARGVPRVRVSRLWLKPRPGTPLRDGLYATIIGDEVVEPMAWQYHTSTGNPMFNVTHIQFDQVVGRVLGKSRVDDVIPKQDQRNRLESLEETHYKRTANSLVFLPEGMSVSRLTGEPGQIVRYNALSGQQPPQRQAGLPPPLGLQSKLVMIDNEIDSLFGLYEIGRGEAPRGVSAYAALQLLDQRAQMGQSNLMDNWASGWGEWARINLDIWREYADEDRTLSLGEGAWAVQKFNKSNLEGGVDVSVETGVYRPRTQIGMRATIEQAARLALLNPANPSDRFAALTILGVPELMEDYKLDASQAARENDAVLAGMPIQPPRPWENDGVHMASHRRRIVSEEVMANPNAYAALDMHMKQHWQSMMQKASVQPAAGTMVPGQAGGSQGTAKGDGGGGGDEGEMMQRDAQGESPDINAGGGSIQPLGV